MAYLMRLYRVTEPGLFTAICNVLLSGYVISESMEIVLD